MGKRILLLEPEGEIRSLLIERLAEEGYEVSSPIDSYVGLECALASAFDLVMLNAKMPLIDGANFLSSLHEQGIQMPAVVFFRNVADRAPFTSLPSCILVQKPFQIDAMLQQIAQLIRTE